MNLKDKLYSYVKKFNRDDEEIYIQDISNSNAFEWLRENIPLFECPDKTLEEIYYFRWWTFRKHVKTTEDGVVITEFLPPVSWAGKHNTIVCSSHFHIWEARWLKCRKKLIEEYALFWLQEKSFTYRYGSSFLYSLYEYCQLINDYSFGMEHLDLLVHYYETMAQMHSSKYGLYYWIDNYDGGEHTISGHPADDVMIYEDGISPVLNSYMAANAYAISEFAARCGRTDIAEKYSQEHERIRKLIVELMWDGTFFKRVHGKDIENLPKVTELQEAQDVKELWGYFPWIFGLVPDGVGYEKAFLELKDENGFYTKFGPTTAEQRHPRFLYEVVTHECLFNGYVWPYTTAPVLMAMLRLLDQYHQDVITKDDFYDMLLTYAKSHYLEKEDGTRVCWIDECMDPRTGEWYSRKILKEWGWRENKGGYERGKDYNHSTFCDLILRALLGIKADNGVVSVNPKIPDDWEYFRLDNLWIGEDCYQIVYDKHGTHYNEGVGLKIRKNLSEDENSWKEP